MKAESTIGLGIMFRIIIRQRSHGTAVYWMCKCKEGVTNVNKFVTHKELGK